MRRLNRLAEINKHHETGQQYLKDALDALGYSSQATTNMLKQLAEHSVTELEIRRAIQRDLGALESRVNRVTR